jgi:hypothetical protein
MIAVKVNGNVEISAPFQAETLPRSGSFADHNRGVTAEA